MRKEISLLSRSFAWSVLVLVDFYKHSQSILHSRSRRRNVDGRMEKGFVLSSTLGVLDRSSRQGSEAESATDHDR